MSAKNAKAAWALGKLELHRSLFKSKILGTPNAQKGRWAFTVYFKVNNTTTNKQYETKSCCALKQPPLFFSRLMRKKQ